MVDRSYCDNFGFRPDGCGYSSLSSVKLNNNQFKEYIALESYIAYSLGFINDAILENDEIKLKISFVNFLECNCFLN